MNPSIYSLTDKNKQFISKNLNKAKEICNSYLNTDRLTIAQFDELFLKWSQNKGDFTSEDIANGLGVLFGEKLVKEFSFSWKLITDEHGTEYALVEDNIGSIIFPINSVWKRIEPKLATDKFFEPMWKAIQDYMEKEQK